MNKLTPIKFIPIWLISRRRYFSLVTLDAIIIFLIFIKEIGILNINLPKFIFFETFWILLSYSLGRYSTNKINLVEIFKTQIKKSFIFTLSTNFIYLFIYFFTFDNFNTIFFEIITISLLSQIILNKIIVENYEKAKEWLFLGDEVTFKQVKQELHNSRINANLLFFDPNLSLKNNMNFKGLVIARDYYLSKDLEKKLRNEIPKSYKILSIYEWSLLILQRLPNLVIYKKSFIKRIKKVESKKLELGIKRISDIFFSFILILLTFPIVFLAILFIKLEDNGPIFYSQIRTGLNYKKIRIWKLRTMYTNSEEGEAKWATKDDKRITKIGKILRKTRIDELPQLFSIIMGDMSLIGPRPERPEFDEFLKKEIPNYSLRYTIKPGLSGWAQVNYNYGSSIKDAEKKLSYDLFYLSQFSIWIDLLIFFKTINLVINGRGSEPNKLI